MSILCVRWLFPVGTLLFWSAGSIPCSTLLLSSCSTTHTTRVCLLLHMFLHACPPVQMLAESLSSFPAEQLFQVTWAYAQFGHSPPAPVLAAMLAQAEACAGGLQPDNLAMLLGALITLGVQPSVGLLTSAAELAVANMGSSRVASLVELLQVRRLPVAVHLDQRCSCCMHLCSLHLVPVSKYTPVVWHRFTK